MTVRAVEKKRREKKTNTAGEMRRPQGERRESNAEPPGPVAQQPRGRPQFSRSDRPPFLTAFNLHHWKGIFLENI